MDSRIKGRVEGDHQAVPWMVAHAATVINKGREDDEGFTACRRWKVREFTRPAADFGESVMRLPAASVGKNKFDVRWEDGVWLGMKMEGEVSIVGATRGVASARGFMRKPKEGGPWSNDGIDGLN